MPVRNLEAKSAKPLPALTKYALLGLLCLVAFAVWAQDASGDPSPVAVPEPTEEVSRYYFTGNILYVALVVWSIAVPGIVAFTGFGATLRNWARKISNRPIPVSILCYVFFMILMFVVSLPIAYYSGYVRPHAYGLSNQTLTKWATDETLMLAVQLVIGSAVVWIPFLLMRRMPRAWWIVTGLLICPFIFFIALILPVYIEPLFTDFGPMKDKVLETKILSLAERAGIAADRVYEAEMSVDTNTVNAYVTGFLGTKRIVLWDTTLERLNEKQVLFIMAHEMGHYVLNHVVMGVFFYSGMMIAGLFLVHKAGTKLAKRYGKRLGFDHLGDPASLPTIVMLMQIVFLAFSPVGLAFSRHIEIESDRFALELTRYNEESAAVWSKLIETNMSYPSPGPIYKLFRASHPTPADRINFANSYHPWTTGEPMKYQHLFLPEAPANQRMIGEPEEDAAGQ